MTAIQDRSDERTERGDCRVLDEHMDATKLWDYRRPSCWPFLFERYAIDHVDIHVHCRLRGGVDESVDFCVRFKRYGCSENKARAARRVVDTPDATYGGACQDRLAMLVDVEEVVDDAQWVSRIVPSVVRLQALDGIPSVSGHPLNGVVPLSEFDPRDRYGKLGSLLEVLGPDSTGPLNVHRQGEVVQNATKLEQCLAKWNEEVGERFGCRLQPADVLQSVVLKLASGCGRVSLEGSFPDFVERYQVLVGPTQFLVDDV